MTKPTGARGAFDPEWEGLGAFTQAKGVLRFGICALHGAPAIEHRGDT